MTKCHTLGGFTDSVRAGSPRSRRRLLAVFPHSLSHVRCALIASVGPKALFE